MSSQFIEQTAREALSQAVWDGRRRRIARWLTRKSNRLLSFGEIYATLQGKGRRYVGVRTIPLNNIVGSVGRSQEFDCTFAPRRTVESERWVRVAKAYYENVELPPVELYKVGELYFVADGNHRISVASACGQRYVDAYVTEIDAA